MLGLDFITRNFFGNLNERKLKPYAKRVERINALEPEFEQLTDEQLRAKTHFLKQTSDNESLVKRLDMLPVECVVRNIATGSLCRRLGVKEGIKFEKQPLFEFFLKDDDLGDPLINDNHIIAFKWGTADEIEQMKKITFDINKYLCKIFDDVGLILVDYKVEYGRYDGKLILGDEFTPDGFRIWDKETGESLDKDRFRKDLGDVVESYQIVAHKLGVKV